MHTQESCEERKSGYVDYFSLAASSGKADASRSPQQRSAWFGQGLLKQLFPQSCPTRHDRSGAPCLSAVLERKRSFALACAYQKGGGDCLGKHDGARCLNDLVRTSKRSPCARNGLAVLREEQCPLPRRSEQQVHHQSLVRTPVDASRNADLQGHGLGRRHRRQGLETLRDKQRRNFNVV